MDETALVSFDIDNGQRVIDAMENAGIAPDVALWAVLPEYEDWRLVLATPRVDRYSQGGGYAPIHATLRDAKMPFLTKPTIFLRDRNDPFIQSLRYTFGHAADVYGMRLGGQKFGNQYIEDAFVYRIR